MLNAFHTNGLAYVLGGTVGDRFRGFVNARGEVVIKARDRMSDDFRCGLVRFDNGYAHGYLDAAGEEVFEQEYEWAEDFDAAGAAVAHYLEPLDEDAPEEARAAAANRPSGRAWGVLRSDGRFIPVHHLEPLTDAEGWVLGFGFGTGLAAFVTRDGGVAHVDRDGLDVCRVEATADGAALRWWTGPERPSGRPTRPRAPSHPWSPPTARRLTRTWSTQVHRNGTSPTSRASCSPPSPAASNPAR
ncbi:hypothetical protein ABT224_32940 [Streptomyces sp. NPDC001584]|uniref:hypothetical protein n=1 Tax=Streptomyces sp. NPDC001584 TaxID=3154521 RepID=UPI00331AE04B